MKNVKGIAISNVESSGTVIRADVRITGTVKEAEVNPKWVADKLTYTVKVSASIIEVLELFGADLRIAIAGRLRKTDRDFVEGLRGSTHSLSALEALIDAATPETAGSGVKAQAAKLREMLKGMGLSDEEIDGKLSQM